MKRPVWGFRESSFHSFCIRTWVWTWKLRKGEYWSFTQVLWRWFWVYLRATVVNKNIMTSHLWELDLLVRQHWEHIERILQTEGWQWEDLCGYRLECDWVWNIPQQDLKCDGSWCNARRDWFHISSLALITILPMSVSKSMRIKDN